jgi:serine/threonine protein kinase
MADGFLSENSPVPGYALVQRLGINGSTLYLARQLSSGKQVVLMVSDAWFAESLQRHVASLARLDHPNIVRVFEIGKVEGSVYAAVEYVGGQSLAHRLREGPMSVPEAAALTRTIALTLEYARDQGMTHLNLTPASIVLSNEGVLKLSEFELMEVVEQSDEAAKKWVVGKPPAFWAPEDFMPGGPCVFPTADVYRVGTVMYTMLTGQPPFAGSDPMEIVKAVMLRPPSHLQKLNPTVSIAAEAVCMKCLEKRIESRHASLQELADDLGHLMKTG